MKNLPSYLLAFPPEDIQGRKVAVLIHNLVKSDALEAIKNWAIKEGVILHLLAPSLAPVKIIKITLLWLMACKCLSLQLPMMR